MCNPLVATVSGLFGKFTHTGWGFAKKGTKILRHYGSKGIGHSEGGKATLCVTNFRKYSQCHFEVLAEESLLKGTKLLRHWGTKSNSLKLQASVQRNVAIASNRDLREQNTECAVRRCNDAVGAVPIHSNVRFSSCSFAINGSARKKLTVFPFRPQLTHAFFGSFSFFLHHNKKKEMNNKKRDCFATLAMTYEKCRKSLSLKWLCHLAMTSKRSFAFTLSEVLIVLAVLGVVAAITIPSLIQDAQEKALITALKKNYTIFSQAVDMAVAENGSITSWDLGTGAEVPTLKLYDILKPYLRIEKECGTGTGCFAEHYEALYNESWNWDPNTGYPFRKAVLASGASFYVYTNIAMVEDNYYGYIIVDVNGKSAPNKAGVDLFGFNIFADGLEPAGQTLTPARHEVPYCTYKSSSKVNGWGCTWWAIKHENMDYLRKDGKYTNY